MNQLELIVISAVLNGIFAAIGLYIGLTRGTGKTVDVALVKIEKRMKKSPTVQRLSKTLEIVDKLFGDDQAVEQMTGFFKEARELVGSPEAKNFFSNAIEFMKKLGGEPEKKKLLNIPEKP